MERVTIPGVRGLFTLAVQRYLGDDWVSLISHDFDSDSETETYPFLGQAPGYRLLKGGRQAKGARSFQFQITNEEYEATLEIAEKLFRRDKTQQIQILINGFARKAVGHWAKLLTTLILSGKDNAGYDGEFFFDTDHSSGASGNQSNDLSTDISADIPANQHGSTTSPSVEEAEWLILKSIEAILGFKDDEGDPMNSEAKQFLVMVPTPYWSTFAGAIKNPVLTSGKTNTITSLNEFSINLAVNPLLTYTEKFATFRTDTESKALIRQSEVDDEFDTNGRGSGFFKRTRKFQFLLYASRNVGFGAWQNACLHTLT